MSTKDPVEPPVAAYIPIPPSATLIPPPLPTEHTASRASSSIPLSSSPHPPSPLPSFPPSTSISHTQPSTSSRKSTSVLVPGIGISTNVSDLLLSSLLPPGLPKLPSSTSASSGPGTGSAAGSRDGKGLAKPRELSTVREGLRLDVMSNNFRRFVTKVGPVFWMQDRVEEVLYWRKPVWTWGWIMVWGCISFQPRLLLLLPFLTLLILLLHTQERLHPVKTLFGVRSAPLSATARLPAQKVFQGQGTTSSSHQSSGYSVAGGGDSRDQGPGQDQGQDDLYRQGVTTTTGPDGEMLPAVPAKEAESGVDYFMNLQAIQNTMGWVSDAYDDIAPLLASFSHPSTSPISLPLSSTSILLLLLPPTALLPLTPSYLMPYLLLPIGWGPTLIYHPHIAPLLRSLPTTSLARRVRAILTDMLLTDALPDDIGRCPIQRVEVWENERLDPAITAKPASSASAGAGMSGGGVPPGSWSYRFLRAGERLPWVKVVPRDERQLYGLEKGHARRMSSNTTTSLKDDNTSNGTTNTSRTSTSPSASSQNVTVSPWYDPHDTLPRPSTTSSANNSSSITSGSSSGAGNTSASAASANAEAGGTAAALKLKDGWRWVPGEEWMVDMCVQWNEGGADEEGWVYSDDSWQNMSAVPMVDADTTGPMPALRRPTRRRRWWRRVYYLPPDSEI